MLLNDARQIYVLWGAAPPTFCGTLRRKIKEGRLRVWIRTLIEKS